MGAVPDRLVERHTGPCERTLSKRPEATHGACIILSRLRLCSCCGNEPEKFPFDLNFWIPYTRSCASRVLGCKAPGRSLTVRVILPAAVEFGITSPRSHLAAARIRFRNNRWALSLSHVITERRRAVELRSGGCRNCRWPLTGRAVCKRCPHLQHRHCGRRWSPSGTHAESDCRLRRPKEPRPGETRRHRHTSLFILSNVCSDGGNSL